MRRYENQRRRYLVGLLSLGLILVVLAGGCGRPPAVETGSSASASIPVSGENTEGSAVFGTLTEEQDSTFTVNTTKATSCLTTTRGGGSKSTIPRPETTSTVRRDTTVNRTVQATTTTAPPVDDGRLEKQGFGFYGLDLQNTPEAFRRLLESDYVNTFFLGRSHLTVPNIIAGLKQIDAAGKTAWLNISECFYAYYGTHTELQPLWKENLHKVMDAVEKEGLMRSVRGIYWDEPFLCKIDKKSFVQVTKYFRETFPDKGIFICLSVAPIMPSLWKPDYPVEELDAEAGRYLTDIAYDYYADVRTQGDTFDELTAEMKRRLGRDDIHIWYVPCTMSYGGQTDELYSIEHVQGLYDRLLKQENPGGIMCYSYYTIPPEIEALGNIGLDQLLAPDNPERWNDLEFVLQRTGRAIVNKPFVR